MLSIAPLAAVYTTPAQFAVTFSAAVTGVDRTDFQTVTKGAVAVTGSIGVSGSGSSYTVTVNGIVGTGTLGLNLVDNNSIRDLSNDPLVSANSTSLVEFQAARVSPIGTNPAFVAVADLNGDARPDLAICTAGYGGSKGTVVVLLSNGDGTFLQRQSLQTSGRPVNIAVGDWNGDGRFDLAVAGSAYSNVQVMLGNGNGTFTINQLCPTGKAVSLASGDLNGDGRQDLVVAQKSSNNVGVLLGNGNGTFRADTNFTVGTAPTSVALADLNGDGRLDLAVTNSTDNRLGILLGNSDGTFAAQVLFTTGNQPASVRLIDVSGDGVPDAVVANQASDTVSVLLGNGNGTFAAKVDFSTRAGPVAVAVGDLNGDNLPDLAVANKTGNSVSLLLGNGNGTFVANQAFSVGSGPVFVALTDLNGDGRVDVATPNYSDGTYSILWGNGNGTVSTAATIAVGNLPNDMQTGDVNGDGLQDLVVTNYTGKTVSVLLANGNGTFAAAQNLSIAKPGGMALQDVNGDGRLDLAVTNYQSSSLSLFLGNGNGTFLAPQNAATGAYPTALLLSDVNGDGRPDAVVVNSASYTLSVLLGNGNGTFAVTPAIPTGQAPDSVAIGDVDHDGHPDLAVANYRDDSLNLFLGNGNGTFVLAQNFATGFAPEAATLADLNGDGDVDLVVVNKNIRSLSVFLGNGNGTFATPQNFSTGLSPIALTFADVNGDGDVDAIVSNYYGNSVSILLGRGDGTFFTAQNFVTGTKPSSILVADFNSDGRLDLVIVNKSDNTVSLLLANGNGNFTGQTVPIDQTPPTAAASGFDVTAPGSSVYTFSVTYDDNLSVDVSTLGASNVRVTGPNGYSQLATFTSVVAAGYNDTAQFASYTVPVPSGSWHTSDNGTYSISMQAGSVKDEAGNAVPAGTLDTFSVNVDTVPPTSVLRSAGNVTVSTGPKYTFTVQFNDNRGINIASLTNGDVSVTGPNSFSQSATFVSVDVHTNGTPRTATYSIDVPAGAWHTSDNGTYTINQGAGTVQDTAALGVASGVLGTFLVNVDTVAPTAAWSPVVTPRATPVDQVTVTFSEPIQAPTLASFTLNGTRLSTLSGISIGHSTGNAYVISGLTPFVTAGNPDTTYTVAIASDNTLRDAAGNALAGTPSVAWVMDKAPPTAVWADISSPRNTPADSAIITFSEAMQNVTLSNFTLNGAKISTLAGTTIKGFGNVYLISGLTPYNGTGNPVATNTIAVASGNTLKDALGNAFSGLPSLKWTVDSVPPTLTAIYRLSPANQVTNATSVTFLAKFSEAVTGVNTHVATDFVLAGTASAGARFGTPTTNNGGISWSIPVNSLSAMASGSVQLNLTQSAGIQDLAANALSTTSLAGLSYSLDHTAPALMAIYRLTPATQVTNATSVTFLAKFSEAVSGVDANAAADFALAGTAIAGGRIGTPTTNNGGISWSIPVTGLSSSSNGTVQLNLAHGTGIRDLAANSLTTTSLTGLSYVLDHTRPALTAIYRLTPANQVTNATSVTFLAKFSEAVTGVDANAAADFVLAGTAIAGGRIGTPKTNNGGISWSIPVTGLSSSSNGTVQLNLAHNTGVKDLATNALATTTSLGEAYTLDHTAPKVVGIYRSSPSSQTTNLTSVTFLVKFSEAVTGVNTNAAADFALAGTAIAGGHIGTPTTNNGGISWSIPVTGLSSSANGTVQLNLTHNTGLKDLAGNTLTTTMFNGQGYALQHTSPDVAFPTPSGAMMALSAKVLDEYWSGLPHR